jgi:hypothetical protein
MRKEFVFDPEAGNDELIITMPEKIAKELVRDLGIQLSVHRNPERFTNQPDGLTVTMQWIGQFIISS